MIRKRHIMFCIYFFLICIFLNLSIWQIQRFRFKLQLNNKITDKTVITNEEEFVNSFYKIARVRGEFLDKYIFIYKKFDNSLKQQTLFSYMLLMPFKLSSGKIVMLSPGWVKEKNITQIKKALLSNQYNIGARILPSEKKPLFIDSYSLADDIWLVANLPAISKTLNLEKENIETAYYLVASDTQNEFDKMFNQIELSNMRNLNIYHHLGYAITWFGFALIVIIMGRYLIR